MAYLYRADFHF